MPEITVSVKQDEENPLVNNVIQLVNHDDEIVLVADMRTKNVEFVATGGTYEDLQDDGFFPGQTAKTFFFQDQEYGAEIIIRGKFQYHWQTFCEVSRYSAYMCIVKIDSSLGVRPAYEVWRRDGKD